MSTRVQHTPPPPLAAPRAPRPVRKTSDHRRSFWPRYGARLIQWVSPCKWLGKGSRLEANEPLDAFSGLRSLNESKSFKDLQGLVDRTQATPDGGGVHTLVDLALFSENEPRPAD